MVLRDGLDDATLPGLPRPDARLRQPSGRASSERHGRDRLADGGRRRQWLRQIDPDEGHRRRAEADGGSILQARGARIAYLPQQSELDRPSRHGSSISFRWASGRSAACSAASPTKTARRSRKALMAVGLEGFREAADRHAVGRPVAAGAVRAGAGAGRRDHPARRAVQRDRRQDRRRPDRADQALARREAAPSWSSSTTSIWCASIFPRRCCWRASLWPGATRRETLRPENLLRARRFDEAWHDDAPWCEPRRRQRTGMSMRTITTMIMITHDHHHRHPAPTTAQAA